MADDEQAVDDPNGDDLVVIAEPIASQDYTQPIVGVGRLRRLVQQSDAGEFAVVVSDAYQRRGIGKALMQQLCEIARKRGLHRVFGWVLPENQAMLELCRSLGARLNYHVEQRLVEAVIDL